MPSLRSIGAGALAFVLLSMVSGTARAGASARLVYDRGPGAEGCAGEPALRSAVAARLGYDPFFPWAHDTVVAEIERTGDGFRARVKLVGEDANEHGAREIAVHNESCAAVTEAMALTISLIIDPSRMTGGPPAAAREGAQDAGDAPESAKGEAPESTSKREVPGSVGPPAVEAERGAPDARPTHATADGAVAFEAGAQVLGVYAPAPAFGAGFAATFGIAWRSLSLDVEGRFDAPVVFGEGAGPRAQSWIVAGQVVPCVHFAWAFGCAVVAAGAIEASGYQISHSTPQTAFWAAAGGRLGAQAMPFGDHWILRAFVDVAGAFPTEDVKINGARVYTVSPVAGALGFGAVWRFP